MKPRRLIVSLALAIFAAGFGFPARVHAADFAGLPCYTGHACTLTRSVGTITGYNSYLLSIGGTTSCLYAPYPASVGTWSVTTETTSTSWTIQRFTDAACSVEGNPALTLADTGSLASGEIVLSWSNCIDFAFIGGDARCITEPAGRDETSSVASTTDAELKLVAPDFGFNAPTSTGNGSSTEIVTGTLSDKLLGNSANTIPACFISPWLDLIGALDASTNGTADPQSLHMGFKRTDGSILAEADWSFKQAGDGVKRYIGFNTLIADFWQITLGVLWLFVGLKIGWDIYSMNHQKETGGIHD